ncbi:MAG: hypothetical protein BWY75_02703 [bacterium ADurb.Bin425]|nr:MAG: hypothetical protein BWY75_02703 [bacterium ADurb.Bin425]
MGLAVAIKLLHGSQSFFIVTALGQTVKQFRQTVIFEQLSIVSSVALFDTITIDATNFKWVDLEIGGYFFHYAFDGKHTLRTTKTSKGGVRRKISLGDAPFDTNIRQIIGIIDMGEGSP